MAGPLLDRVYEVSADERVQIVGNLNFFFSIGAMISVLFTGKLMDVLGRRRLNLLLDLAAFLFILLISVKSLFILQLTRALIGFVSSAYCMTAGITLVEVFPTHLASLGNMLVYIAITGTTFLGFIQQTIFSHEALVDNWRVFMCYPAVIALGRFCILSQFMTYDSPKYITSKYGNDPEYPRMLRENFREIYTDESAEIKVEEILAENKIQEKSAVGLWEVLTHPDYRQALISALVIQIGQQLSGVNFFVFFSTEFFDNLSGNGKTASFFVGLGNLLGGFAGMFIVNSVKRLTAIRFGVLAQGCCFFLILALVGSGIYMPLPLFVLLYMLCFGIGLGATANLYVNELLPPAGVGFSLAIQWLAASLIGKLSPIGVAMLGSHSMIALFGGLCFLIFLVASKFCIDTQADKNQEIRAPDSLSKLLQPLTDVKQSTTRPTAH